MTINRGDLLSLGSSLSLATWIGCRSGLVVTYLARHCYVGHGRSPRPLLNKHMGISASATVRVGDLVPFEEIMGRLKPVLVFMEALWYTAEWIFVTSSSRHCLPRLDSACRLAHDLYVQSIRNSSYEHWNKSIQKSS